MFIINCEIYPIDILVYFGKDMKPLFKELSETLPKSDIDNLKKLDFHVGKSVMFSGGQVLLWLHKKPNSVEDLAFLAHEIYHCACFILNRVGIVYSQDSEEAFAYLVGYITKKIYSELNLLVCYKKKS